MGDDQVVDIGLNELLSDKVYGSPPLELTLLDETIWTGLRSVIKVHHPSQRTFKIMLRSVAGAMLFITLGVSMAGYFINHHDYLYRGMETSFDNLFEVGRKTSN